MLVLEILKPHRQITDVFLNDISQNEMKPASRTIDPAFGIDFWRFANKPEYFQALTGFEPVHLNTSLGLLPSRCFLAQLVTVCILSLGGTGSNAIEARNFLVFLKKDCNVYSEKEYSFKLCKDSEEIVCTLMYFTYVVVKIRWYQTVDSKFDSSSKLYTSDGYWRADLIRQPTDRNQRVLFIAGWAS